MNHRIIPLKFNLALLGDFIYSFYLEFTNAVFTICKQLKINMTGAIGVLESIYVHNAFQCIIGAAPVAIFVKESSAQPFSLPAYSDIVCGAPCYGNYIRNSSPINVASLISEFGNTSS